MLLVQSLPSFSVSPASLYGPWEGMMLGKDIASDQTVQMCNACLYRAPREVI